MSVNNDGVWYGYRKAILVALDDLGAALGHHDDCPCPRHKQAIYEAFAAYDSTVLRAS